MTDHHFDLPAKHTVLRSFAGHLDASPDDVYPLLVARLIPGDEAGGHMLTDPDARLVIVEGDWWYRAEYRVRPEQTAQGADTGAGADAGADADAGEGVGAASEPAATEDRGGSVVEFEIINVAQKAHWAGAITARSVVQNAPAAFGRLLTELDEQLSASDS